MSKRRKQRRVRGPSVVADSKQVFVGDGLKTLTGGLGDLERDKAAGLRFAENDLPLDQLIAAYSSNWIARKIIDIPAEDALRKGRTWQTDDRIKIEAEEKRLGLRLKIIEAYKQARLLGGAAILIGTADKEQEEPLNLDSVGVGGVKYLTVLNMTELNASETVMDPASPYYGVSEFYEINNTANITRIHASRFAIFNGDDCPHSWTSGSVHNGWRGQSVLKTTADAIKNAGGSFANVASLVYEANVDALGIPEFMEKMEDPAYEAAFLKRAALAAAGKSVNGMMLMDAEEILTRNTASFANLDNIMGVFGGHCAAAEGIPITRFLGTSPSGLQSTGEADERNYADKLQGIQEFSIEPAIVNLDQCVVRSAVGDYPQDLTYSWNPFRQMSEKETAEIAKFYAETFKIMGDMSEGGSFTDGEIKALAMHKFAESGVFPHIEKVLAEAEELEGDEPEPEDDKPKREQSAA